MLNLYIWMTGKINTFQMTSLLQSFDTSSYFAFSTAVDSQWKLVKRLATRSLYWKIILIPLLLLGHKKCIFKIFVVDKPANIWVIPYLIWEKTLIKDIFSIFQVHVFEAKTCRLHDIIAMTPYIS